MSSPRLDKENGWILLRNDFRFFLDQLRRAKTNLRVRSIPMLHNSSGYPVPVRGPVQLAVIHHTVTYRVSAQTSTFVQ